LKGGKKTRGTNLPKGRIVERGVGDLDASHHDSGYFVQSVGVYSEPDLKLV